MGNRLATMDMDMDRKWGCCAPPLFSGGGELDPHLTQCRLDRGIPRSAASGILIHPAVRPQQTWAENWGVPLWGSRSNSVAAAKATLLDATFHLDRSYRLATIHQRHRQDNGPIG